MLTTLVLVTSLLLATNLLTLVSAQYELLYPSPRGAFSIDGASSFCGGHDTLSTRAQFPLTGGHLLLRNTGEGGHTSTTVLLSTHSSPTNFTLFNSSSTTVVPFFDYDFVSNGTADGDANGTPDGQLCIPLELSGDGVSEGSNVTVQVAQVKEGQVFYQCADLTLTASAPAAPSEFECKNGTASGGHDHDHDDHDHDHDDHDHDHDHNESTGAGTSTQTAPGSTNTNGAPGYAVGEHLVRVGGLVGVVSLGLIALV